MTKSETTTKRGANTACNKDFESLMRDAAGGSEEAAWRVVELYGPYVFRSVRRALHPKIRPQFDSVDFVQAVWASLFASREKLNQVEQPQDLIALLSAIGRNKVVDVLRQQTQTLKYDISREVSTDRQGVPVVESSPSRDPTPSDVAIARERWEQLMRGQPSHYRSIVVLRMQGETHQNIARQLNVTDRTVRRVLTRLLAERCS